MRYALTIQDTYVAQQFYGLSTQLIRRIIITCVRVKKGESAAETDLTEDYTQRH
jgi:hypothetical protein